VQTQVAWIDDIHRLTVITKNVSVLIREGNPAIYQIERDRYIGAKIDKVINDSTVIVKFSDELPLDETLILKWANQHIPVYPGNIVRTEWFDARYNAHYSDLGAICNAYHTTFTIWAPTATSVILFLNGQSYELEKKRKGIWTITIPGDWHGYSYMYGVTVNGKTNLVNDPYAKAMLPNSKKGVIVDFSRTDQLPLLKKHATELQDAIIYELHVRDATIQEASGVKHRGKFLGLTEKNTATRHGYSTALSYISELGCTHVQLLPINDYARVDELNPEKDYNWGYDPLYYQVPEGSYSIHPEDPISRINELKQMIHMFHQEGISVILDVVYNHVYRIEKSDFEKIVPGYYFRYHPDGSLSNGTGVGNDIASERKMVRKFILDTIDFWLREYKVDGFRFDLMGILDTETMQEIHERTKQEEMPIMLLGEGWELPTALPAEKKATSRNSWKLAGIRFFNDFFRDTLKGNLFKNTDAGYVNDDGRFIERMPHLVTGSVLTTYGEPFVSEVNQTVNYVEVHDNHTLWDRLKLTNKEESKSIRKKMHQLATGITLLSQGVPFLHAGQEWFRTKYGDENSYISGDKINQLNWKQREQEIENIEFVKKLITFRKRHPVLRLRSKREVARRFYLLNTPAAVFGFALLGDSSDIAVYVNPTGETYRLRLPSTGKWKIAVTNHSNQQNVEQEIIGEFTKIEPYELMVFEKLRLH